MDDLDFIDNIYDPVWKNIPITDLEKRIIESDIFRRLMNIKQMSLAYVAFSGANHTRYEHSIGTMHVAYKVVSKISILEEYSNYEFNKEYKIKDGYKQVLQFFRIAALLHDLGHPPFSHAIEWIFQRNPELYPEPEYSHDIYTQNIILENKELKQILKNNKIISPKNLANFLKGNLSELPKPIAILYSLIEGDLDVDKVDYIIRDNYHCGLPVNLDINSITESFEIIENKITIKNEVILKNIEIKLKPDMVYVVENLLFSRLQLVSVIHHEKKNRIANQMLMNNVKEFLEHQKNTKSNDDYEEIIKFMHEKWTDYDIYKEICNLIEDSEIEDEEKEDIFSSDWGIRALKGDLIEEALIIPMYELDPIQRAQCYLLEKKNAKRTEIEKKLEQKLGFKVVIDFALISPPPLTLELSLSNDEYKYDKSDTKELIKYSLLNISNIIKGILKDSFRRSFIAVYHEKGIIIDKKELYEDIINEIKDANIIYRSYLFSKNEICEIDFVLLVYMAIKEFSNKINPNLRLWSVGIKQFQNFIRDYKKNIKFNCKLLDELAKTFSIDFNVILEKLTFYGLIDQRSKYIKLLVEQNNTLKERYLFRYDHCINSYGRKFIENFSKDYAEITDTLLKNLEKNKKLYIDYFNRKIDFKSDKSRNESERIRVELRKEILPIIGI